MLDWLLIAWEIRYPLFVAAWWWSARRARQLKSPLAVLGPIAILVWLWKERRELRGLVVFLATLFGAVVWGSLLMFSPNVRWAAAIALPVGLTAGAWVYGFERYRELPIGEAARYAMRRRRSVAALTPAVRAAAGEGARLVPGSVVVRPDGSVEAEVVGAPGHSHDETLSALRETLAESVLAVSGREFRSASVVGTAARGRVKVRCVVTDPYEQMVRLEDLR
jgi:hypothetical protein